MIINFMNIELLVVDQREVENFSDCKEKSSYPLFWE